jgi:lysophospholipase L1-like esterase
MKNVLRCVRVVALSAAVLASFATLVAAGSTNAGADPAVSAFYLDIGGSASLGVQPTVGYPKGQRTDDGYADYLVTLEATKGVTLDLHEIGCSGETTNTMLHGGDKCYVSPDTQLNEALSFLQSHHDDDGLITIDLGFNDLRPCFHNWSTDQKCVMRQLATVRAQLTEIIDLMSDVAGPNVRFVGVGHYDPFLGDALNGQIHSVVAVRSLTVIRHLDQVLSTVYRSFGIPMANVGQAFEINSTSPVAIVGLGTVPENVAEVCQLTWMCQPEPLGPNIHPNAAGYETIAAAINRALIPW